MPRPPVKRAKLNHRSPSKRVANRSQISPRTELQQKVAHKPVARVPSDSDDSDKLVVRVDGHRNGRGIRRNEIYASGGVGPGDTPGAHELRKNGMTDNQASEVNKKRERGVGNGRSPDAKAVNGSESTGEPKKENPAITKKHEPINPMARSPVSMPRRALGTSGTESSILGHIKPRKRQPSILQLLENENNNSSELGDEDEDDFLPQDESTPLNLSKAVVSSSTPLSSLSRPSNPRKRKLGSPSASEHISRPQPQMSQESAATENVDFSTSKVAPRPSINSTPPNPADDDDEKIMAPPQSSSPPPESSHPQHPPQRQKIYQPPKNTPRKPASAISTSALQALMPKVRHRWNQNKSQQRSQLRISEFEIPADGDEVDDPVTNHGADDEEDESYNAPSRIQRKATKANPQDAKSRNIGRAAAAGRNKTKTKTKTKSKGRTTSVSRPIKSTLRSSPLRTTAAPAAKSSQTQQLSRHRSSNSKEKENDKGKATYVSHPRRHDHARTTDISGHHDGDKENRRPEDLEAGDSDDDNNNSAFYSTPELLSGQARAGQGSRGKTGGELDTWRKKFEEVDNWDMEFEDVTDPVEEGTGRVGR